MKKELLNSLKESDIDEESDFNIQNIIDRGKAIERIKYYGKIIKTENKKTIRYEAIQEHMLKKTKDIERFVENAGLSRSTIYFEIGLYEFLKK